MVAVPRRELPIPIRTSLPLILPILLAGAIALGIGVIGGLHGPRILLAAIGLIGMVLAAVALFRPPTLVLDADGLALRTPIGERWRQPWAECGQFRDAKGTLVVWANSAEAARHPRRAASWRKRADADTGLVAQFGSLGAADLAALLNQYRSGKPDA
jgi:hypothetical protein